VYDTIVGPAPSRPSNVSLLRIASRLGPTTPRKGSKIQNKV
jgi:hypothetical protein